jgi:hypothetical protein
MRRPSTPPVQVADLGGFFRLPTDVSGADLAAAIEPPAIAGRARRRSGLAAGEAGAGMTSAGRAPFLHVEVGESEVRAAAGVPHALDRPDARRGRFR